MPTQTMPSASLRRFRDRAMVAAIIVVAVVMALMFLLLLTGHDPGPALTALWSGSFGSSYAITSATLVRATPLILTGLAVGLAFRAGVWNIGAEGQLLAGASAATAVALWLESPGGLPGITLALVAGGLTGAIVAGIAGLLRLAFGVLEIISTIMLNFITIHLVGFLVRGPLQESSGLYPQSETLSSVSRLPLIIPGTRLHLGIVLAIGAALMVWALLRYTEVGFRIRAVGANPVAARTAGSIDVARTTLAAFLMSGLLAGIAGAVEVMGVTFILYESLSPGYGFTAIAVALLARLHPLGIMATGTLLGALQAGGSAMQRDAGVPSVLVSSIEALLILGMAAGAGETIRGFRWRRTGATTKGVTA